MGSKDIYDRRPTSTSRGKTIERIMALQHEQGMIPGAVEVIAERPAGSIAEAIMRFHSTWVETKPVTTRRAYERSLAFFARDLAANAPSPQSALDTLGRGRVVEHLDWRIANSLTDPGELQRAALHLTRFCEFCETELGADMQADRAWMREQATMRIAQAPPAFHVATSAQELRDTSGDADRLAAPEDAT